MTRLHIRHSTEYQYNETVTHSYNEVRMTPLTDSQQVVLDSTVDVTPSSAAVMTFKDYWGTRVSAFDVQVRHTRMSVESTTTVEIARAEPPLTGDNQAGWEELLSEDTANRFADWLPQSGLSEPGEEVRSIVKGIAQGKSPHEAAVAVFAWLRGEMTYVQGLTGVRTNAQDAWQHRKGVCQDLSHLSIGALRSLGIPAKYVSGYLHPRSSAGIGETVTGQSHAWVEWWDGEWRSWDPTNHKHASDFHVTVARGRDYRDVTPLRGLLNGGRGSTLNVSVEITRLA